MKLLILPWGNLREGDRSEGGGGAYGEGKSGESLHWSHGERVQESKYTLIEAWGLKIRVCGPNDVDGIFPLSSVFRQDILPAIFQACCTPQRKTLLQANNEQSNEQYKYGSRGSTCRACCTQHAPLCVQYTVSVPKIHSAIVLVPGSHYFTQSIYQCVLVVLVEDDALFLALRLPFGSSQSLFVP